MDSIQTVKYLWAADHLAQIELQKLTILKKRRCDNDIEGPKWQLMSYKHSDELYRRKFRVAESHSFVFDFVRYLKKCSL